MAQTVGGKSVAIIRTILTDTAASDLTAAELDHATKVSAEIVSLAGVNPTFTDATVNRTLNGRIEIITVLVWV